MPNIPIGSMATREIAIKRRTVTGKVVKCIQFKCSTRQAPRSKAWVPGVNLPSLQDCLQSVPPPSACKDIVRLVSSGWFHAGGWDDDEAIDMADVYRQICLFCCLLSVAVQGLLRDTIHMGNEDRKGWAALFFGLSLLMLLSSAFHALVHISFSQKMSSDAQIQVFNTLYQSRWHMWFSPIRVMQYGMIAGVLGGFVWMLEFISAAYCWILVLSGMFLGGASIYGTLAIIHAGLGVLEAETLHYGEHVSLDWEAVKALLTAYEEDCGSEFISPTGFAAFAGACVLKSGCDEDEICEFSYVTRLRMDGLVNQRIQEVAAARPMSDSKEGQTDEPPGSMTFGAVGPKITRGRQSLKGKQNTGTRRGGSGQCFADSGATLNCELPTPPPTLRVGSNEGIATSQVDVDVAANGSLQSNGTRSRTVQFSDDEDAGASTDSAMQEPLTEGAPLKKGTKLQKRRKRGKSVSFDASTKPAGMELLGAQGSSFDGNNTASSASPSAATNAVAPTAMGASPQAASSENGAAVLEQVGMPSQEVVSLGNHAA